MSELNSNLTLELETLSPIHVGAGKEKDWVRGLDFVQDKDSGEIRLLDKSKIFAPEHLKPSEFKNLLAFLERNDYHKLYDYLEGHFDWDEITLRTFVFNDDAPAEIKPLIQNGWGQSYLPGSSIKGAIRSILFRYLHRNAYPDRFDERLENDLLGSFDRSLSRFLRPSDAEPTGADNSELYNLRLYNLYGSRNSDGWEGNLKKNLPITAEHFRPGAAFRMRLSIADGLLHFLRKEEKKVGIPLTPTYSDKFFEKGDSLAFLFQTINAHSKTYLDREIEFFEKFDRQHIANGYLQNLEKFRAIAAAHSETQCLLRLGAGSGFHSVTGDWRFKDHIETVFTPDQRNLTWNTSVRERLPARYKSRKVIPQIDSLPGFLLIRLAGTERFIAPNYVPIYTEGSPSTPTTTAPIIEAKIELQKSTTMRTDIPFEAIRDNEVVFTAQVVEIIGSEIRVFLFITAQNLYAKMTLGAFKKSFYVEVNDIVRVKVANRSKTGQIAQVSFVP